MGNTSQCSEVPGHIITLHTVSPGQSTHQPALFKGETDGKPIYLRLNRELQIVSSKSLAQSMYKLPELLLRIGILQTSHRHPMGIALKPSGTVVSDPLHHRIVNGNLRMRLHQLAQLVLERIILLIRHLTSVLPVVELIEELNLRCQLFDTLLVRGLFHGICRTTITARW
ncbi:MAG: hypothetical protein BWY82_02239 [Verrucomicrobia bacterium ADurb.Bin474]|nr:MAG: hypothetical protein BWY82_02239 [Verrucomicrobia bacterium ADurb.Bin474]